MLTEMLSEHTTTSKSNRTKLNESKTTLKIERANSKRKQKEKQNNLIIFGDVSGPLAKARKPSPQRGQEDGHL